MSIPFFQEDACPYVNFDGIFILQEKPSNSSNMAILKEELNNAKLEVSRRDRCLNSVDS